MTNISEEKSPAVKARVVEHFYGAVGREVVDKINADYDYTVEHPDLYTVSDKADLEFLKELKSIARKSRIKKRYMRITIQVAVLMVGILGAISLTSINSEAFKVRIYELLHIENTEEYFTLFTTETALHAESVKKLLDGWEAFYYPNFLPNRTLYFEHYTSAAHRGIVFENDSGEYIEFVQSNAQSTEFYFDNSDTAYTEIAYNGKTIFVVENENSHTLYWQENETTFEVTSDLPLDSLYEFLDGIVYIH